MLPTEEFTELTEKGVKQFQTDYMKISPTGEVDRKTLDSIDEFSDKYRENLADYQCKCGECEGFGAGQFKGEYSKTIKSERYHKYEYPGMHQSLLWAVSASRFYLCEKLKGQYSINSISSAYRCWNDNNNHKGRSSTNHMGKAVDLHFNKNGFRTKTVTDMDLLREKIYCERIGAPKKDGDFGWERNKFGLEPFEFKSGKKNGATTWVHVDVREFQTVNYLKDRYFINSNTEMYFNHKILTINNDKK